ncbi:MAG: recombinase family protein [Opitutus sp.]
MATNNLAFSYIRCSTPKQHREGDTKRRQLDLCAKYARENGLILSSEGYEAMGVSAFRGKNVEEGSVLFKLIDVIKEGKIIPKGSTIIIENLDRLSRNFITESLPIFMDIIRQGVNIVTLTDRKVYSQESIRKNPFDLMYSIMILSRGHEESVVKSVRTSEAWKKAQLAAATTKIKQSYPAWLKLKDNQFTVIPEKAKIVTGIFQQYLDGHGTGYIARYLNERGVKTFTGLIWYQTTVKFYLRFPAVIGQYHVGKREGGKKIKTGVIHEGYYPPIISHDDFYRVQARMKLSPSKMGRPQREDANMFNRILKCGYCGSSMGIYNATKSNSYVCWNAVTGGCVRVAYPVPEVEKPLLTALEPILSDWGNSKIDQGKIDSLEGQIEAVDAKMTKLIAVIEAGADTTQIVDRVKELKNERTGLVDQLEREKAYVYRATQPPDLTTLTPSSRLDIMPFIRRYVKQVTLYPAGDKSLDYRHRMAYYAKKGQNGSQCYHVVRKELDIEHIRYFTAELIQPIFHGKVKSANMHFDHNGKLTLQ